METYQVPSGKPYCTWQAVFDDAQPLPWRSISGIRHTAIS
jgi:hypothetical protein